MLPLLVQIKPSAAIALTSSTAWGRVAGSQGQLLTMVISSALLSKQHRRSVGVKIALGKQTGE
jgi:hypothetical protein